MIAVNKALTKDQHFDIAARGSQRHANPYFLCPTRGNRQPPKQGCGFVARSPERRSRGPSRNATARTWGTPF
jgi:hypothetical protein